MQNLKVYVDVLSLIKSKPKINKINLSLEELDVIELNNLSKLIKPSNFKSFLNNKIKDGKLISEIDMKRNSSLASSIRVYILENLSKKTNL